MKISDGQKILIPVSVIAIVGLCIFLFSKTDGHTGAQILAQEGAGFWAGIGIAFVLALVCAIYGIFKYNKTQEVKSLIVPIAIALIAISIALGKGCTDKANSGVTTEQGRPSN